MFRAFISLASLAVIFFGCRYAYAREQVRRTDLPETYRAINRLFFKSELPAATVVWADLPPDRMGETVFIDGRPEIHIDRRSHTDEIELLDTVGHEACHVYV